MGTSVITVRITGNHGCQRDKKHGEVIEDCGSSGCVDCVARRFVKALGSAGQVEEAHLLHWPQDAGPHIIDNLKTGVRTGSF